MLNQTSQLADPLESIDRVSAGSVSDEEFRRIIGAFPTGVTVVTARDARGSAVGLCANSVTSVSLDPPLLLVCLDRQTYTLQSIRASSCFVVNFLRGDQEDVARLFASREADKFSALPHTGGEVGAPVIDGCAAVAECVVHELIDAGDHVIVIGRVVAGQHRDGQPLLYFGRHFRPYPAVAA
jgi:flavin reductase (DIM6/NTAB) family NADH-FMN oxidoreductase RutF